VVVAAAVLLLSLGAAMLAGALLLRPVAAITAGMARWRPVVRRATSRLVEATKLTALALQFNELSQRISSDARNGRMSVASHGDFPLDQRRRAVGRCRRPFALLQSGGARATGSAAGGVAEDGRSRRCLAVSIR